MGEQKKLRSLINELFSKDFYVELVRIAIHPDLSNNEKGEAIYMFLEENNITYEKLGRGTNRVGIKMKGYVFKIALDEDGQIDNRREFLYSKQLQPYVVKCYECIPDGLIAVFEPLEVLELQEFHSASKQMRVILRDISDNFLIGDVGITPKNRLNWGKRMNGSICILDYAYIYSVKHTIFYCDCDSLLRYDNQYNNLICPNCGREFTFGEIRRRITKDQQEEEIGDIRRLGYNIKNASELVEINPKFQPKVKKKKDNKKKKKEKIKVMTAKDLYTYK